MRLFQKRKDGGKESTVDAFFLIELKGWFSVALLRFNKGSRENYHSHAFDARTWFLKGDMIEMDIDGSEKKYKRSLFPKFTPKYKFHKVYANKTSWCFTIRGKWDDTWREYNKEDDIEYKLTHGRKVVSEARGGFL